MSRGTGFARSAQRRLVEKEAAVAVLAARREAPLGFIESLKVVRFSARRSRYCGIDKTTLPKCSPASMRSWAARASASG